MFLYQNYPRQWVVVFVFQVFAVCCLGQEPRQDQHGTEALTKQDLPSGDGLAAKYPGDQGIETDSAVIFAENFEVAAIADFSKRWDTVRDPQTMSLSEIKPGASSGKKSLLISQTAEQGTGGDLYTRLPKSLEETYARFYVRFAEDCEPMHHFGTCIGGNQPATPWPQVKAGIPPAGDRSYWVGIEPFGAAWRWDYYAYWHQMRGSPPRGQTWGNSFIQDEGLRVVKEEWICVELMTKLNDIGHNNGELALWLDGKLVSHLREGEPRGRFLFDKFFPKQIGEGVFWDHSINDRRTIPTEPAGTPFPGLNWRTRPELKTNFVWIYVYLTKGSPGHTNRVWFDDCVVASQYIGPLKSN